MSQPPASTTRRSGALWHRLAPALCAFLFLVTGCGHVFGSLTKPAGIAQAEATQVASEPRFKLEIGTGLICGNDPVNRADYLGMAPISSCAPTDAQIAEQIQAITAMLHRQHAAALQRNEGSAIGWRPPQFVKWGSAQEWEQLDFLKKVQAARKDLGPNGYGTYQMQNVLNRHFGDINEEILSYFTPKGGYATSANMRANFRLMGNVAVATLGLSLGGLPGPDDLLLAGFASRAPVGGFTGAGFKALSKTAEDAYSAIRQVGLSDVATVANNSGLSLAEATTLKRHVFFGTHRLPKGGGGWVRMRFTADDQIAHAWQQVAAKGELSAEQKTWFRQLADHELAERRFMGKGIPYRNPASWDPDVEVFWSSPPGAHDLAPLAPRFTFPGFSP